MPKYVYLWIRFLKSQLETIGSGSTFAEISGSRAREIPILIAPTAEQKRIVAKVEELFARVNVVRDRLARVNETLKRFRQSVLADACSGRLTGDWRKAHLRTVERAGRRVKPNVFERREVWEKNRLAKMRAPNKTPKHDKWKTKVKQLSDAFLDELPELPETWCWGTIEQLASAIPRSIQSGPFGSSLHHSEFQDEGILAIGIDNVLEGRFSFGREHRISEKKYKELKKYTARPSDVLMTVMGTVGRCCVLPEDMETAIITKHVYRITVDQDLILPTYFMYALRGDAVAQHQIKDQIRGQTRPGINGRILKSLMIPTPTLEEQVEIVQRTEILFKLADTIEKRHAGVTEYTEKLPQAILAKAFRGELVPTETELARREGQAYEPASALLAKIRAQSKYVNTKRKSRRWRQQKNE